MKLVDLAEKSMKEKEQKEGAVHREKLHLMPPAGWLNDPNGLCQFNGIYHAFFQYSPFNAEGGVKMWGHYTSKDLIDWEYQGVKLLTTSIQDVRQIQFLLSVRMERHSVRRKN